MEIVEHTDGVKVQGIFIPEAQYVRQREYCALVYQYLKTKKQYEQKRQAWRGWCGVNQWDEDANPSSLLKKLEVLNGENTAFLAEIKGLIAERIERLQRGKVLYMAFQQLLTPFKRYEVGFRRAQDNELFCQLMACALTIDDYQQLEALLLQKEQMRSKTPTKRASVSIDHDRNMTLLKSILSKKNIFLKWKLVFPKIFLYSN